MKSLLAVLVLAVACSAQSDPCQIPPTFLDLLDSFSTALGSAQASGTLSLTPTPGANYADALTGAKYLYAYLWYYNCTTNRLKIDVDNLRAQVTATNGLVQQMTATTAGTSSVTGKLTGTTTQTQGASPFPWFTGPATSVGVHSLGNSAYQWSPSGATCPGGTGCSSTACPTNGGDNACANKDLSLKFSGPDHGSGSYPGSPNQCPINGYAGSTSLPPLATTDAKYFGFQSQCSGGGIAAQSGGLYDNFRHRVYRMGGGHGDDNDSSVFMVDLTQPAPALKRVKDPLFPPPTTKYDTDIGNPAALGGYNFQPNAGPEDTNKPSFNITVSGDGIKATVVCTTPCVSQKPSNTMFNPFPISGTPDGKPFGVIAGTTNFNGGFKGITYISATSFSFPSTVVAAVQTGTATAAMSNCFPAADGTGCAPVSRHTTQGAVYIPGTTTAGIVDHTQDLALIASGAIAPIGGSRQDTWWLPLGAVSQAATADWTLANMRSDFHPAKGTYAQLPNFGDMALYDPVSRLVFDVDELDAVWFAYDRFGDGAARTPNTWYRQTANFAGVSNDYKSGAIWTNSADSHNWLVALGGGRSLPIATISQNVNTLTVVTSAASVSPWWIPGYTRVYIDKVADPSFNVGDGTNDYLILQTVSGSTLTFTVPTSRTASSTGGVLRSVDSVSKVEAHDNQGVAAADISNTSAALAGSLTSSRWNTNTMARSNVDLGDPMKGNTCAEMLTGGTSPLWQQGYPNNGFLQNPGMDVDRSTGKNTSGAILVWPQEGMSLYAVYPDPANQRIKCQRFDYTAQDAGANWGSSWVSGNEMSGTQGTNWGLYPGGKSWYDSDIFFVWSSYDQGMKYFALQR